MHALRLPIGRAGIALALLLAGCGDPTGGARYSFASDRFAAGAGFEPSVGVKSLPGLVVVEGEFLATQCAPVVTGAWERRGDRVTLRVDVRAGATLCIASLVPTGVRYLGNARDLPEGDYRIRVYHPAAAGGDSLVYDGVVGAR